MHAIFQAMVESLVQIKSQLAHDAASRQIKQSLPGEARVLKNTRTDSGLAFAGDILLSAV